jgi:hypothetical protein
MSVYFYDRAFELKIKEVFPNTIMGLATNGFANYFEETATEKDGLVTLPLVGVTRVGWSLDEKKRSHSGIWFGAYKAVDTDTGESYLIKSMAIQIKYQIDIISDKRLEVDGISAEMAWFLTHQPKLAFEVTKPFEWQCLDADVLIEDVVENTDIMGFRDKGRLYRSTFDVVVDNAYLYHSNVFNLVEKIPFEIRVVSDLSK